MNFNNNEVRKVINHVSSRWLSTEKCLERCSGTLWDSLVEWDSLKSFFLSNFNLYDDPVESDPDDKPNREKRLVYKCIQMPDFLDTLCLRLPKPKNILDATKNL